VWLLLSRWFVCNNGSFSVECVRLCSLVVLYVLVARCGLCGLVYV
jgi:hypothetical protein